MADKIITLGPVPEADYEILADCYCRASAIPQELAEDGVTMQDTITSLEHIKAGMLKHAEKKIRRGFDLLTLDGNKPDAELIERTLNNL